MAGYCIMMLTIFSRNRIVGTGKSPCVELRVIRVDLSAWGIFGSPLFLLPVPPFPDPSLHLRWSHFAVGNLFFLGIPFFSCRSPFQFTFRFSDWREEGKGGGR